MTPSTASCTLWTMNPSRMSYRDHGKPRLASFRIRISTLLGPILTTYLSMTVLQEFICHPAMECATPQSCRVVASFGHVWFLSWCCCLCAEPSSRQRDRTSFGRYDRGIHLTMTVMPSVTRPLAF